MPNEDTYEGGRKKGVDDALKYGSLAKVPSPRPYAGKSDLYLGGYGEGFQQGVAMFGDEVAEVPEVERGFIQKIIDHFSELLKKGETVMVEGEPIEVVGPPGLLPPRRPGLPGLAPKIPGIPTPPPEGLTGHPSMQEQLQELEETEEQRRKRMRPNFPLR